MPNTVDLVPLLAGPGDDTLIELVEDTLYSIWMRSGSPNANHLLADAVQFIHEDKFGEADLILRELVLIEPDFAEPHHQRGIVLTLQEHFEIAGRAFESALKWNPHHFSAAANLGHALVQREDYLAAIKAYERALGIHPNMREVAAAVESIEQLLHRA